MLRLLSGDTAYVPAHWPLEVSNALITALRRKRIPIGRSELFLDELYRLPIAIQPPPSSNRIRRIFALSQGHSLTTYDAAYLELAEHRMCALASLDAALRKAALSCGIALIEVPA